ncbi:hypothetical protein ACFQ9X_20580 [Catenulispora yoronensis]
MCGLHITATVANATSSALNFLVDGKLPSTIIPLQGSPLAADLYPVDPPRSSQIAVSHKVSWWISAKNGSTIRFSPAVTQTVAGCSNVTPVH